MLTKEGEIILPSAELALIMCDVELGAIVYKNIIIKKLAGKYFSDN